MIIINYKTDFSLYNKHSCKSEALMIYSLTSTWMQRGAKLYNNNAVCCLCNLLPCLRGWIKCYEVTACTYPDGICLAHSPVNVCHLSLHTDQLHITLSHCGSSSSFRRSYRAFSLQQQHWITQLLPYTFPPWFCQWAELGLDKHETYF